VITTKLNNAYAAYENGTLEVNTGKVSRKWLWPNGSTSSDYNLFALTAHSKAELRAIDAYIVNDRYIEVVVITTYPELYLCVKYVIWAYPGASGLRTQLFVKSAAGYTPPAEFGNSVAETVTFPAARIKAAGYYNDTQNRNRIDTELIREEDYTDTKSLTIDWASMIALFNEDGSGVCVVKESHKCVNQTGYETGAFVYHNGTLAVTGIGLTPRDITEDRYRFAWATWTIYFDGGDEGLETAIKAFDRLRFPTDETRDIYIMANTWGNTGDDDTPVHDNAAGETVLKDLAAAAELGVDVLQVDDGWQFPMGGRREGKTPPWYPEASKYPTGWDMISGPARKLGVTLGVWFDWTASADEMIDNMRLADFKYFKIDFACLNTRERLDLLVDKARKLRASSGGDVRINWDVTEIQPRMGYYFGREFGNVYLENRKPRRPTNVIYTPYLVLRDTWQLAKYANLNKFQIPLQNLDRINREVSDAWLHNFSYCAMIAFMGSPILFQQVQYLTPEARRELKEMISIYKKHRDALYRCIVYPIGSKPDNASWTGFQFIDGEHGHIVLFRELNNTSDTASIRLKSPRGCDMAVTNVMTGKSKTFTVNQAGIATFSISTPCGFLWYAY